METTFTNGYAFILEGATEKEFYWEFLLFLCKKHSATIERVVDDTDPDIVYKLTTQNGVSLIKFNVVNTITQMPRAGNWFNSQCVKKHGTKHKWYVFLCYDTDDYNEDISKFYEGDWANLRSSLKKAKQVVDVAAAADIEDTMLVDIDNVCAFLGGKPPVTLKGSKGKRKMKNLFRDHGKTYHEGSRAKPLIQSLDMEFIMNNAMIPLKEIEALIF